MTGAKHGSAHGARASARHGQHPAARMGSGHSHYIEVVCRDRYGREKWRDGGYNLVVNEGLDEILDKFYKGSSYTADHYVALLDSTPTVAAGDTMSSHAGWSEVTAYSEAARQGYSPGTVSGQSVDNSGAKASYSIDTDGTTIGGAALTTDSTKGGSTGILIGAAAFSGSDKSADSGDTLDVTVTATASS